MGNRSNQIILKQKVGEGWFGEVWEGVWNDIHVAVKFKVLCLMSFCGKLKQ